MKTIWFVLGLAVILSACSDRRGITPSYTPPNYVTYDGNMKAILDGKCISCHGSSSPSGSYSLSSYAGVLGNGSDGTTPNAIPGDMNSLIIQRQIVTHYQNLDEISLNLLIQWVVTDSCREN